MLLDLSCVAGSTKLVSGPRKSATLDEWRPGDDMSGLGGAVEEVRHVVSS